MAIRTTFNTPRANSDTDKDATPTGLKALTGHETGKVKGSAEADRATLYDLTQDKDQVINTGAGDDVFIFHGAQSKQLGHINAVVDLGTGHDTVYLAYEITDYLITTRDNGDIKLQYVGTDASIHGAAITFKNADSFVFRNVDDETGVNYANATYSADDVRSLVFNEVNSHLL